MKAKHTPGPWVIDSLLAESKNLHVFYYMIKSPDNKTLAEVKGKHHGIDNNVCEANTNVMAAAPEMLEALIEISEGKGRYDLDPIQHAANCIEDMKALALEAIKKATL